MTMSPKFVFLWTDITIWVLVVCLFGYAVWARRSPTLRSNWRKVFQDPAAMASSTVKPNPSWLLGAHNTEAFASITESA